MHRHPWLLLGAMAIAAGSVAVGPTATDARVPAVAPVATTTTLSASSSETRVGQPVTFTASVSAGGGPIGAGTVTFSSGGTELAAADVNAGSATFTTAALAVGLHGITAAYNGTAEFSPSTSNTVVHIVRRWPATLELTATWDGQTLDVGELASFSAVVQSAGGVPSGQVVFSEGVTVLGERSLAGGAVAFAWAFTTAGPHTITATYAGGDGFEASSPISETVTVVEPTPTASTTTSTSTGTTVAPPVATTTTIEVEPDNVFNFDPVTLTAVVTPQGSTGPVPGGAVTFSVIVGTPFPIVATVDVVDGTAIWQPSALGVGTATVTATYSPAAGYATSQASTVFTIHPPRTETVLGTSPRPSDLGQTVSLRADVTMAAGGVPVSSGTVTFLVGEQGAQDELGTVAVAQGAATLDFVPTSAGTYLFWALYDGGGSFSGSMRTSSHEVRGRPTQVALSSSPNPSAFGEEVTFTARVFYNGTVPEGQLAFSIDGTEVATSNLDSTGTATFSSADLDPGSHEITAAYRGAGDFAPSSGNLTQQVSGATTTSLEVFPNPAVEGDLVTLTATVTAAGSGALVPGGGVLISIDGEQHAAAVTAGVAVLRFTLDAGTYAVMATFDRNIGNPVGNFEPSASDPVSLVVTGSGQPTTSTTPASSTPETTAPATTEPTPPSSTEPTTTTAPPSTSASTPTPASGGGQSATTTRLSSSENPAVAGEPVTFTVGVASGSEPGPIGVRRPTTSPPAEGGSVTISDGGTVVAVVELEDGRAAFTTSSLTPGTHTITAAFGGTASAAPSSDSIEQRIDPGDRLPASRWR